MKIEAGTRVYAGGVPIIQVYLGNTPLWSEKSADNGPALSCYANGYWMDDYPWTDETPWTD